MSTAKLHRIKSPAHVPATVLRVPTRAKFGYLPSELNRGSGKPVVWQCPACAKVGDRLYYTTFKIKMCQACANKNNRRTLVKSEDLTGRKIGRWKVLEKADGGKLIDGRPRWLCVCKCGTERSVRELTLLRAKSLSCGCYLKHIVGKTLREFGGKLATIDVFVFGSNLRGAHGAGAALFAFKRYGAKLGKGVGIQGNSYAIPTKGFNLEVLPIPNIAMYVEAFKLYAKNHPEITFQVTRVGCGLAGYDDEDIAPLFKGVPVNCTMPPEWKDYL